MPRELCFLTAVGKDRKGIIARISNTLYGDGINIEDVDMKVIDGYVVLTIFMDMASSDISMEKLRKQIVQIEREMGLKIQVLCEADLK